MDTNAPLQTSTSGSETNQKKDLLKKLMSHVMDKAGSSLHDTIAGITSALGAYKNFAKEWDNLHGATNNAPTGSTGNNVQSILRGIQEKKQSTSPSTATPLPQMMPKQMPLPQTPQTMPIQAPQTMPPTPKADLIPNATPSQNPPQLIAGQDQTSKFNRPAPVSNLGIWGT